MSLSVFLIVLFAAFMHAGWNAIVKGGSDKLLSAALITFWAAVIAVPFLLVLPLPLPESRPYIATSIGLQCLYLFLVVQAYKSADMSRAYPIMRGTAPVLVTLIGVIFFQDYLSPLAWVGIGVLCAGILATAGLRQDRGALWALLNACVIASYTMVDGAGVRLSGSAASYTLWLALFTAVTMLSIVWLLRGRALPNYVLSHWKMGLLGGLGTTLSYGLALWAMTMAPVAIVAALRETSILFGVLISVVILHEVPSKQRLIGAMVIAGGAMVLRLA